ncbi:MAG: FixH family protein [Gallionellaceae bacterium]|nr:FixH family protein [Gallionellaceae bacterium]
MISQSNKQGIRNPWVLGFAAIVLSGVLVNVFLVWNVMHNPVRLLDDAYSVKNHNKAEAKWVQQQVARNALGWQAKLHFPQQIQGGDQQKHEAHIVLAANPAKIRLELSDREGKSVLGGQVAITAQWPGNASHDFSVALHEVAQGQYENSMSFPKAGNWDLHIKAQQGGHLFEMEQRVFVAKSQ